MTANPLEAKGDWVLLCCIQLLSSVFDVSDLHFISKKGSEKDEVVSIQFVRRSLYLRSRNLYLRTTFLNTYLDIESRGAGQSPDIDRIAQNINRFSSGHGRLIAKPIDTVSNDEDVGEDDGVEDEGVGHNIGGN
ncbi:hypothetical protein CB1_000755001 [Camelus ferus]|nr:hypothetical protein CB1_000755001 [Camelus ferus]